MFTLSKFQIYFTKNVESFISKIAEKTAEKTDQSFSVVKNQYIGTILQKINAEILLNNIDAKFSKNLKTLSRDKLTRESLIILLNNFENYN